jgi:hypothetical protein
MKFKMPLPLLLVTIALVANTGCRKEKEQSFDIVSARDDARAELSWNDVFETVDEVASNTDGLKSGNFPCVDTCIVDTLASPMTLLIDFGSDYCVGNDGRTRTGQILVTFTGRYRDPGTVIVITPQNHYVDGYLIEGVKTVTNQGNNGNGQPYFSVVVSEASITAPNNEYTITWNSTRTRTWISGYNTLALWDDVYEITGEANGINRDGEAFSVAITEALRLALNCPWITSGTVQITPSNGPLRVRDYGNGTCDNDATVTVNGNVYEIVL